MLSFINIMGKKNPFDEDDGEEGSENGKKKVEISGFIGWQDVLVILVIIGAVFGGYKYYQHTKLESSELFARCALLYDGGDLLAAKACYDSTWDLSYVPNDLDSLRVIRLGAIQDLQNAQEYILEDVRSALQNADTAKALSAMRDFKKPVILSEDDASEWGTFEAALADRLLEKSSAETKDSTAAK